jgi:hypothetical protein
MSIVEFTLGFLIGFASHEAGHQITASVTGMKSWWEWRGEPTMVVLERRGFATDPRSNALGVSGFISNQIAVEAAMMGRPTSFKRGIIVQGFVNPVGYIIRNEIKPYGDIKRLEAGGVKKSIMYPALIAMSSLNAYRLFSKKKIPVDVGVNSISIEIRF